MMVQESGGAKAAEEAIRHPVAATGAAAERRSTLKPPEQVLKCPRCDSLNTKFCYYNNYSLTQPRHFCKSCRRYWTKGGALRNVPIGGGCRKNKRANKQNPQRTAAGPPAEPKRHPVDREPPPSSTASDVTGGLKLFQSLSQPAGSFMEFPGLAFTRLQEPVTAVTSGAEIFGQRAPLPTSSTTSILQSSCQALANLPPLETTLLGLRTENLIGGSGDLNGLFESPNVHPQDYFSAADLQWRIHQHRLAMLAADQNEAEKENISRLHIKPCKPEFPYFDNANRSEWQAAATAAVAATGGGGGGHHPFDGTVESAAAYWNPLAAWSDLQLYATSAGALP